MNILETIIASKHVEIQQRKARTALSDLESSIFFQRPVLSLSRSLSAGDSTGIIAEFKRRSPSKGNINADADVVHITKGYADGGAAALSVLTDQHFFGGSSEDLQNARINSIPILRKDFIIDEYQIVEAKSIGADVILLIAACLSIAETKRLALFARSLGLEVLLEVHDESELRHINEYTDIVGVNNRDLKSFVVDIRRSLELVEKIPFEKIKISESGLNTAGDILTLKNAGFNGFLIGERFMRESDPGADFSRFVHGLKAFPSSIGSEEEKI